MARWHDERDSLQQLFHDIKQSDNAQSRGIPDSVVESAQQELRRRGFTHRQINNISLGRDPNYNPYED